jgi:hypothetical protein
MTGENAATEQKPEAVNTCAAEAPPLSDPAPEQGDTKKPGVDSPAIANIKAHFDELIQLITECSEAELNDSDFECVIFYQRGKNMNTTIAASGRFQISACMSLRKKLSEKIGPLASMFL